MSGRLAGAALVALAALGCRETAKGAREDARDALHEAKGAMREAQRDVHDALRDAGREAEGARREAEGASRQAAADLHDAKQLLDVRAALAVSNEIASAADVTVRTDEAGRVLYLEGTVGTAAEKAAAERIARDTADGLRVSNRLRVAPRR